MVFHKKKQKNVDEGDAYADKHGDYWIYIAKKADTKLHLAHSTGKRVQKTADKLMKTVKKRCKMPTDDEKATFTSDGNSQYIGAILNNFKRNTINYGQIIKERVKGTVISKIRKVIFGEMDVMDIDTVYIERYNLTMRHSISRLVRKTICFSKCNEMADNHIDLFQCYNNLNRVNSALEIKTNKGEKNIKRTPCMAEGITDHIWSWKELLMFKVGVSTTH